MNNDTPPPNDPHADAADALVDAVLRETLGGELPPDQREAILTRAADEHLVPLSRPLSEQKTMSKPWYQRAAAGWAIAASLLIVTGFLTLPATKSARDTAHGGPRPESPTPSPQEPQQQAEGQEERLAEKSELGEALVDSAREEERDLLVRDEVESERGQETREKVNDASAPPATPSSGPPVASAPVLGVPLGNTAGGYRKRDSQLGHFGLRKSKVTDFSGGTPVESLRRFPVRPDRPWHGTTGDQYAAIVENPFVTAKGSDALSTFSIDVDTASYANTRQFLMQGNRLPPRDAVRIEELVNYFDYDYEAPTEQSATPFNAAMEVASCPWAPKHRLVRIALKGREIEKTERPLSNLVFLVDVSGSMNAPNKLPLVVRGLKQLARRLGENDRVAVVVYASSQGLALPSTPGSDRKTILAALDSLAAGGSTAGGAGIQLAYQIAEENFIPGGTNRVLLCTDGDFNVGLTGTEALGDLVERKAKETRVFLSVLGFGRGNLNDAMMETISDRGNGNYAYIDNMAEARKVLVEQMTGTLVTIAKDVKIQVEFNPAKVAQYRLLGYENRVLANKNFNDDTKDAGEIGAGHTVTAFYELIPVGVAPEQGVDPLKYQVAEEQPEKKPSDEPATSVDSEELLTLKLRYKEPEAATSSKVEFTLTDTNAQFEQASPDYRFGASVAQFGLLLRRSEHRGEATYESVIEHAEAALGDDPHGYREEFLDLVDQAKRATGN